MYTFKPFVFTKNEVQSEKRPKARSGHRIVCDRKFGSSILLHNNGNFYQVKKICPMNWHLMRLPAKGNLPEPLYGQALIYHEFCLYTVGGTTGYEYTCDIYKFDLRTQVWEAVYICSGKDQSEPVGRYRHELAFDGKLIYVLGGGTAVDACGFSEIPAFDLEAKKWLILNTYGDNNNTFPEPRRCHGSVQYTDDKTGITSVVICGGYNGDHHIFADVWRLDLNHLQWTCLRKCILPRPVYFHSAALTPEGCMYTFGGIIKENNKIVRTAAVHSVWLVIPKLSEMCWQALIYYYPDIAHRSQHELLNMGIPLKFVQRIS
ncbi:Kelch domain-containing protein 10 homolog [Anthophora retusa]